MMKYLNDKYKKKTRFGYSILPLIMLFILFGKWSCTPDPGNYHVTYMKEDKYIELLILDEKEKKIEIDNNFTFYDGNTVIPIVEGNRIYPCSTCVYSIVIRKKNDVHTLFFYGDESSQKYLLIDFELSSEPDPKYCTQAPIPFKFDSIVTLSPCKIKIFANYNNALYSVTGKKGTYTKDAIWDVANIDTFDIFAIIDENGDAELDTIQYPSNNVIIKKIGCKSCNNTQQKAIIKKFLLFAEKYIKNPLHSDTEIRKNFLILLADNAKVIIAGTEYTDLSVVLRELETSYKNNRLYKVIPDQTLINTDGFIIKVVFQ